MRWRTTRRTALASAAIGAALSVTAAACTSSGTLLGAPGSAQPSSTSNGGSGGSGGAPSAPFNFATTSPTGDTSSLDAAAVAAKITPALVVVESTLSFQHAVAQGTGIVLTPNGEILTNNHVIAGATAIRVTDQGNGKSYTATVVGYDRSEDVAVLQLKNAQGLATAPLATSSSPAVGDAVLAVGNAGGTGTLTDAQGKVTALNQQITASDQSTGSSEQLKGLIGVDADVQPGDSGGPLVNSAAQVIGIDTAANANFQFQQSDGGSAGYAIPIASAATIAGTIVGGTTTDVIHIGPSAVLGVSVSSSNRLSGALVEGVVSGSGADKGGLVQGDLITSLDGVTVDSATTLTNLMDKHKPSETVTVGWTDATGAGQSAKVTLGTGPAG